MTIRLARADDLSDIAAIYDHEVLGSTATLDTVVRSQAEYREWLEAHPADRYPVFVFDQGGVLGWSSLTPYSPRLGYRRCAEVSVYVHGRARGQGVGRALLGALIDAADDRGIRHLLARIESSGTASLRLHAAAGFQTVGTLHRVGEKFGRVLDVVFMEKLLGPDESP